VTEPRWRYPLAMQAADGTAGRLRWSVTQLGTAAASLPRVMDVLV